MVDELQGLTNISIIAIYNLPKPLISHNAIAEKLKSLDVNYVDFLLLSNSAMILKNSCHVCLQEFKNICDKSFNVLIFFENLINHDLYIDKLQNFGPETVAKIICQAKNNKELSCPLLTAEQLIQQNRLCAVVDLIERWFSDEEIFKHKDILVTMDDRGWVPLTVLITKLQDNIDLKENILAERLNKSNFLVIDPTEKFVRRCDPKLPVTEEFQQIVILDIPDTIKSIRQLPAFLKIESSRVVSFDFGTHSALVTVASRPEAESIVSQTLSPMKCRLLVPNILEQGGAENVDNDIDNHLESSIAALNLVTSKQSNVAGEEMHVSRLEPSELTYEFPATFQSPSKDTVACIVKQCNFYFSDANVLKDLFMLKKIKSSHGGWVDLEVVARFKMVCRLSGDSVDVVRYAMCFSDEVQISRDGARLRRRLPLPDWDSSIYTRSLFLWHLPLHCQSYSSLDAVFRDQGRFVINISRFIKANRNVPADLRKLVDKIPALGKEDCGVVEFTTREALLSADIYIRVKWPSVKTFYLDMKADLPKPAVIVGKSAKCLPPPIPISDLSVLDIAEVSSMQAGTRRDPRFCQAARIFSVMKREEGKVEPPLAPKLISRKEFPPLSKEHFKDKTNIKKMVDVNQVNIKKPRTKKKKTVLNVVDSGAEENVQTAN